MKSFLYPVPGLNRPWSIVLYCLVATKVVIGIVLLTRLRPAHLHDAERLIIALGVLMIATKLIILSAIIRAFIRRRAAARLDHKTWNCEANPVSINE